MNVSCIQQRTESNTLFTLGMVLPFQKQFHGTAPEHIHITKVQHRSTNLNRHYLPPRVTLHDIFVKSVNMAERSPVWLVGLSLIAHYQQAEKGDGKDTKKSSHPSLGNNVGSMGLCTCAVILSDWFQLRTFREQLEWFWIASVNRVL